MPRNFNFMPQILRAKSQKMLFLAAESGQNLPQKSRSSNIMQQAQNRFFNGRRVTTYKICILFTFFTPKMTSKGYQIHLKNPGIVFL